MITLARRAGIAPSAVREILKVAEQPDVLSFAGGLPAPELFPVEAIARAHEQVLRSSGPAALQYSTTEGYLPLRSWVAERFANQGALTLPEDVLITAGSQQGIDLVTRVLVDPGAQVVTENPTYLAALQVFAASEARVVTVGSDQQGMRVDELEAVLTHTKPRLIYLVPSFQNPRGITLSLERRQALVKLAQRYQVPIVEDEPYAELRFRGEALPSLASLDDEGIVISLGTFSKTLAPGLRIAWLRASGAVMRAIVVAKQACDLHCSTLAQRAVAQLLSTFDYDAHLQVIRAAYKERCLAMLDALEANLPPGSTYTRPDGGLFVWVELPAGLDAQALLLRAVEQKIAYVPGAPFFAHAPRRESLRLNFSNRPPELIAEGMRRLGEVVQAAVPVVRHAATEVSLAS
jgi:2-aminoadipate transaminase